MHNLLTSCCIWCKSINDFIQSSKRTLKCIMRKSESCSVVSDSLEFSRPKYWSGSPFPSLGDLRNPGIEPRSPALQVDSLLAELLGKPYNDKCSIQIKLNIHIG